MAGRAWCWAVLCAASTIGLGACDFGKYEDGYPVSQSVLRTVEATTIAQLSTAPPTTLPATMPATAPTTRGAAQIVRLTIEEARRAALENNLELRVELINPAIARQSISEERAQYEWVFSGRVGYDSVDPPRLPVTGDSPDTQVQRYDYSAGLEIPLRTGGFLRVNVPAIRVDPEGEGKEWNSDVGTTLVMPLLRGAGLEVNALAIRVATYQYQAAQARAKLEVIRILADVDRIYWRLYAARKALDVRKKEFELAQRQLERARRQAGAGAAAQVEIVRAESGVADTVEGIINAENAVLNEQRSLKRAMNRADLPVTSGTHIIPTSDPIVLRFQLQTARLLQMAMDRRMELLEAEIQIAQEAATVSRARNDLLPLVTLDYTYNVSGVGTTGGESFTMIRNGSFMDHRLGLSVEVPIGNEAARSRLRSALLSRMAAIATREQRAQLIEQEILAALDRLETDWQRILAARRRVVAQTRVVEAEERQFGQGLRTSTEVLEAVTRLAGAALSEIAAVADYQIAQVDIAFATGMLLGATNVEWSPTPTPRPSLWGRDDVTFDANARNRASAPDARNNLQGPLNR